MEKVGKAPFAAISRAAATPPGRLRRQEYHGSQVESDDAIVIIVAGLVRLEELNDLFLAAHQALAQLVERRLAGTASPRPRERIGASGVTVP